MAAELADGAVIVELPFAGHRYLAREILKEAGDAVVLEPDDARQAVLEAAEVLAGAVKGWRDRGAGGAWTFSLAAVSAPRVHTRPTSWVPPRSTTTLRVARSGPPRPRR